MHVLTAQRQGSKTGQVALVGLVDRENRLLLARCSARPHVWQPIGGHVETWDQDPGDAVVREVQEETGINLRKEDLWSITTHPSDTGRGEIHFYLASVSNTHGLRRQEEEIDELRWVTLEEARELPALPATQAFLRSLS